MLPQSEFHHMAGALGLQQIMTPNLSAEAVHMPGFVLQNVKEVTVPNGEGDPEAYAKSYFLLEYGLLHAHLPLREEFLDTDHQVTGKH